MIKNKFAFATPFNDKGLAIVAEFVEKSKIVKGKYFRMVLKRYLINRLFEQVGNSTTCSIEQHDYKTFVNRKYYSVREQNAETGKDFYGIMNDKLELILPCKYDYVSYIDDYSENSDNNILFEVFFGREKSFFNAENRQFVKIPGKKNEKYTDICFWEDYFISTIEYENEEENKTAIFDKNGKQITDYIYTEIYDLEDGVFIAKLNGKWGAIDTNGKTIIDFQFKYLTYFYKGISFAQTFDNKWHRIDKKGNILNTFDCDIDSLGEYCEGGNSIAFSKDTKMGVIDYDGNIIVPCLYKTVYSVGNGFCLETDSGTGFADAFGKEILPCKFWDINYIGEGFLSARVYKEKEAEISGFYNLEGKQTASIIGLSNTHKFVNGLCPVEKDAWGLVDKNGNTVLPFEYTNMSEILNNTIAIEKNFYEWQIIDLEKDINSQIEE